MDELARALVYAAVAGIAIPVGAGTSLVVDHVRGVERRTELRHSIAAFGGGVLLAAVALVLVPQGIAPLSLASVIAAVAGGGLLVLWIDKRLSESGAQVAQLLGMLLDFVPEAIALGALLATGDPTALLLAVLIGLQNLPEGFNAYRDLTGGQTSLRRATAFGLLALCAGLGPLAAWLGFALLAGAEATVAAVMLVAAGGILYLTFQDIAPQVPVERRWAPPLGAVAGFLVGVIGHMLLG